MRTGNGSDGESGGSCRLAVCCVAPTEKEEELQEKVRLALRQAQRQRRKDRRQLEKAKVTEVTAEAGPDIN